MALQNVVSPAFAVSSGWVNPPGNAFDGGLVTNWATSQVSGEGISGVAWIGQDFGSAKDIVQVTVEQYTAATAISSVKLQYSSDGSSWTDVGTYSISKDASLNTIDFSSVGAHRCWRLLANANPGGNERWQVCRITMSELASAANSPSPKFQAYLADANGGHIDLAVTPDVLFVIPYNANYFDTNTNYDQALYRFKPTVAGFYQFNVPVQIKGTISGDIHVYLTRNGEPYVLPFWGSNCAGLYGYVCMMWMNGTTDWADVRLKVDSGSGVVIDGHKSWFEGFYLGI